MTDFWKYFFSSSAILFVGKLATFIAIVGTTSLLTKLLSPEDFGYFTYWYSVAFSFSIVAMFGANSFFIREYPKVNSEFKLIDLIKNTLFIFTFGVLFSFVVLHLFLSAKFSSGDVRPEYIYILFFLFPLLSLQTLVADFLRGAKYMFQYAVFGSLFWNTAAFLSLMFLYISSTANILTVFQIYCIVLLIGIIISCYIFFYNVRKNNKVVTVAKKREQGGFLSVIPLWLSSSMMLLAPNLFFIAIGDSLEADKVGLYATALRISMFVSFVILIVNHVLGPVVSEALANGENNQLESILQKVALISALICSCAWLGLFFFGQYILNILFGSFFEQSYEALLILSFGLLIASLSGAANIVLQMSGLSWAIIISSVAPYLVCFLFLFTVDFSGINAYATLQATVTIISALGSVFFVYIKLGIKIFPKYKSIHDSKE